MSFKADAQAHVRSLRQEGNSKLLSSRAIGLSPSVRKTRITGSLQLYNSALSLATTSLSSSERALLHKNIAVAHRDLCRLSLRDLDSFQGCDANASSSFSHHVKETCDQILFHATSMIEHTAMAVEECDALLTERAADVNEVEPWEQWKDNVVAVANVFISDLSASLPHNHFVTITYRIAFTTGFSSASAYPDARFILCYEMARFYHNQAVKEIERRPEESETSKMLVDTASRYAAESARPASEGHDLSQQDLRFTRESVPNLAKRDDFFIDEEKEMLHPALELCSNSRNEMAILLADLEFLKARIESRRDQLEGDRLLEESTGESLDPELVWSAVDCFRHSIIKAKELDLEMEAISSSRLGLCFSKYLNLPLSKGKDLYRKAIELALSMAPRVLDNEPWFREAKEAVEAYQRRVRINDERQKEAEDAPYLAKLKDSLDKIKEIGTAKELLIHLYGAHPPRKESYKLNETASVLAQLRDALIQRNR